MWRLRPSILLGTGWAIIALLSTRRRLRRVGTRAVVPSPPRRLAVTSLPGVRGVLDRLHASCLEDALVMQAWLTRLGQPADVVIGVLPGGMAEEPAHAWVDGRDAGSAARYLELHRLPPPA